MSNLQLIGYGSYVPTLHMICPMAKMHKSTWVLIIKKLWQVCLNLIHNNDNVTKKLVTENNIVVFSRQYQKCDIFSKIKVYMHFYLCRVVFCGQEREIKGKKILNVVLHTMTI